MYGNTHRVDVIADSTIVRTQVQFSVNFTFHGTSFSSVRSLRTALLSSELDFCYRSNCLRYLLSSLAHRSQFAKLFPVLRLARRITRLTFPFKNTVFTTILEIFTTQRQQQNSTLDSQRNFFHWLS